MPKEKNTARTNGHTLKELFLQRASELWDNHYERAEEILNASEDKHFTLTFKAAIDKSESMPKLVTRLSFSEVITDEFADTLEDPKQATLEV